MNKLWDWLAGLIRSHYRWILVSAAVATVGLGFGLPRIHFKTGQDTFLRSSSKVYQDNLRYQSTFGGDPMLVLFEGDVLDLLSSPNVETLRDIERQLNADPRYFSVVSPLTILQLGIEQIKLQREDAIAEMAGLRAQAEAAARQQVAAAGGSQQAQDEAAQAAGDAAVQDFLAKQGPDAERFAAVGELSLDNPKMPEFVLFDAQGNVRPEMADVSSGPPALADGRSPGWQHVDGRAGEGRRRRLQADPRSRLRGAEGVAQRAGNTDRRDQQQHADQPHKDGGAGDRADGRRPIACVPRARGGSSRCRSCWRAASGPSVSWGYLSLPLTMVTISGLPILIGLGVDFAIQFHSRFDEEMQKGASATQAMRESLPRIGTAIGIAVLAASAGFMVLHISRVPMIRDFGSMLTVGTMILFVACLLLLHSLLYWRQRDRPESRQKQPQNAALSGRKRRALHHHEHRRAACCPCWR